MPADRETKRGPGRPAFEPSDEQRRHVEAHAAYGTAQVDIAAIVGISVPTLRLHFRAELETGAARANARVAESLFRQAVGHPAEFDARGNQVRAEVQRDVRAAIFWLKSRAGWRDQGPTLVLPKPPREEKPGKKAAANEAAKTAHATSSWGTVLQ